MISLQRSCLLLRRAEAFLVQRGTSVCRRASSAQPSSRRKRKNNKPSASATPASTQLLEALQRQSPSSGNHQRHRVLSPRRLAARNLVQLLQADPSWLEQVRPALKLKLKDDSLPADLDAFYVNCLPSFQEVLLADASLSDAVLKALLRVGFDHGKFGRQYWRSRQLLKKYEELDEKLRLHLSELEVCQQAAASAKEKIDRVKLELNDLSATYMPTKNDNHSESFIDRTLQSFSSIFQSDDSPGSEKSQQKRLLKRRDKAERLLTGHLEGIQAAQQAITGIEREKMHAIRHVSLSKDELDQAFQALEQVRNDVVGALVHHLESRHYQMVEQWKELDGKTDLTKPHEWYPHARLDRRRIIYHGGPTNSGKTFQALERLKQAKKGMYLGPLRLLAAEVYEKLTADGIYCSLYTGQDIQRVPFETHGAATVEMANLTEDYDVVVIDEIQMISDTQRGFAWSRALLGTRCKEIHVCGGLEATDIVKRIAASCGDDFELRTYDRFTALEVDRRSLASAPDQPGSYKAVQAGDCVVAFSRKDIFAIKREIETQTKHKCCVIYGTLPPQTRTEQARRFNDPNSGYDVLVASDAVGMGLNLNIKRIVFNSMYKQDAGGTTQLDHSSVKQIAGRAGRRNSPFPEGIVTCRSPDDMAHLRKCMTTPIAAVVSAGIVPTAGHIDTFHQTINSYGLGDGLGTLHSILNYFSDMSKLRSDYFLCRQTPMIAIAKKLANLNLPIRDKYTLCMSPAVEKSKESMQLLKNFASKIASNSVPGLPQTLRPKLPATFDDLAQLCSVFSDIELFLWLQNKFPPVNVMEQQAALSRRATTVDMIAHGLMISEQLKLDHSYISRDLKLREDVKAKQEKEKCKITMKYR